MGPAPEELLGYLRRRGEHGRDGALGAARLPDDVRGGKGSAVNAGMLAAETACVIFADADMATPPDQIPLLAQAFRDHDVAVGSRTQPDGSDMRRTQVGFRRFLGRAFHGPASASAVVDVQDTQCGFKGFTREAACALFGQQRITSIAFHVELIYLARRRGHRMAVVPTRWSDKRGPRMHSSMRLGVRVARDLFRTPLLHRRIGRSGRRGGAARWRNGWARRRSTPAPGTQAANRGSSQTATRERPPSERVPKGRSRQSPWGRHHRTARWASGGATTAAVALSPP